MTGSPSSLGPLGLGALLLASPAALARPGATLDEVDDTFCLPPDQDGIEVCIGQTAQILRVEDRRGRVTVYTWGWDHYEEWLQGEQLIATSRRFASWELMMDGAQEAVAYLGCTPVDPLAGEGQWARVRYVKVGSEVRIDDVRLSGACRG
jgi:hypothetical protein